MSLRLAAALAVVLHVAGVPAATAADLYGSYESGAPDDDPRYGDIYRHPPPPPATAYADPRYPPYARPGYSNDDDDEGPSYAERRDYAPYRREYLAPMPPVQRFEERYAYGKYEGAGCVPRHEIRRELVRDGWRDFQDVEPRGDTAVVTARRPNGQYYRLKIDGCSGQIVRARPIDDHGPDYAWRPRREQYRMY
jgi:hypothetical protein